MRSEGLYHYDSDNKQYIDLESGVWCANLGHSHPKIVQLIKEQVETSIHHGYKFRNHNAEQLSKSLQQVIGIEHGASVFLSSGSEAVNLSITLARRLTQRKKVLKIDSSYLSAYGFGQISPDNDYLVNIPHNEIKALEEINFETIAAVVLETGGASIDMVQFPNTHFIDCIVERAVQHGCLIIAEEVTTGMGRLGKWFGFQHYNVKPDIVVCGKALGNGYPISSVTVTSAVCERLTSNLFVYAQSHQNDPLGCAIAQKVLQVIKEENLLNDCTNTGQYFANQLTLLQKEYPYIIKEIRAKGLMLAVELKELVDGNCIYNELFDAGYVFSCKKNTFRFLPPLIIQHHHIDGFIRAFKKILAHTK